jgi:hypothetical protein
MNKLMVLAALIIALIVASILAALGLPPGHANASAIYLVGLALSLGGRADDRRRDPARTHGPGMITLMGYTFLFVLAPIMFAFAWRIGGPDIIRLALLAGGVAISVATFLLGRAGLRLVQRHRARGIAPSDGQAA